MFPPRWSWLALTLSQYRSLRTLRKLLIAFRSAVYMNEDNQVFVWCIDNSASNVSLDLVSRHCTHNISSVQQARHYHSQIYSGRSCPPRSLQNPRQRETVCETCNDFFPCADYRCSKPPTQTTKQQALQKLILSYFNNVVHLIPQLIDKDTLQLTFSESAKILPYVTSSRKAVKAYLKVFLKFSTFP